MKLLAIAILYQRYNGVNAQQERTSDLQIAGLRPLPLEGE